MTIEELYKLREELVENKEKFSALNAKYNELLSKLFEKKGEKREATEAEFIKGESCIWYWGRFLILMAITLIFKVPNDVALLCIFLNLAIKVIDEHVILPKLWIRKKIRGKSASKEEKDQSELYEEVSKAREKYHELNKEYMKAFNELTLEDENAYLEYLNSLGVSLDIEEENKTVIEQSPTVDTKIYAKINEDK